MSKMTLAAKLAKVRKDISITKDGRNDFANFNYYQIDDIYSKIKGMFDDIGIFTTFEQEPCGKVIHETKTTEPTTVTTQTKDIVTSIGKEVSESNETEKNGKASQVCYNTTSSSIVTQMVMSILTVYDTESDESFRFSNISEMNRGKGMQPAQNAGANITYQSKYAYSTLLMLDDGALDPDKGVKLPEAKSAKKAKPTATNDDGFL